MSGKQTDFDILMEHDINIRRRTIYMHDEINDDTAKRYKKLIQFLSRSPGDIIIELSSSGGDVNSGLTLYDTIRECTDNNVIIKVTGIAMSIAATILQAGDTRIISPHSRIMIHRGELSVDANNREAKQWVKEVDNLDRICNDIFMKQIKEKNPEFKRSKLEKMMDTDTYISAQQALELGLVDELSYSDTD